MYKYCNRQKAFPANALRGVICSLLFLAATEQAFPEAKPEMGGSSVRVVGAAKKRASKGEYFLAQSLDPVCASLTKELNYSRHTDFDACESRFDNRSSEFSSPVWNEVPLDIAVAEKAFRDVSVEFGKSREEMDKKWQRWLEDTASLRAAGKLKMWIANVDINNDGLFDKVARVQYAKPASDLPVRLRGCPYTHSGLYLLSPSPRELLGPFKNFYFGSDSDIIHSSKTDYNYSIEWSEAPVTNSSTRSHVDATRGVIVELSREAHSSPVPVCRIEWVPNKKKK